MKKKQTEPKKELISGIIEICFGTIFFVLLCWLFWFVTNNSEKINTFQTLYLSLSLSILVFLMNIFVIPNWIGEGFEKARKAYKEIK